jgi:hypothetical protein
MSGQSVLFYLELKQAVSGAIFRKKFRRQAVSDGCYL